LRVSDEDVRQAMRMTFRYLRVVAEPGGSAALAAALKGVPEGMKGKRIGIIVSGGNVDVAQYASILGAGA